MIHFTNIIFYLGLSLLLVHELDAIKRREWRIFPLLSKMKNDENAYYIFSGLHIPLFVMILFFITHPNQNIKIWACVILDVFFIIHLFLHYLLKQHKENEFNNVFSTVVITSMAAIGAIHLSILTLCK